MSEHETTGSDLVDSEVAPEEPQTLRSRRVAPIKRAKKIAMFGPVDLDRARKLLRKANQRRRAAEQVAAED